MAQNCDSAEMEADALLAEWRNQDGDERLRRIRRLGEIGPAATRAIDSL
jgi:hypothetical protein